MRDQWYGDKRDLIKWGVLLELACQRGAKHILQVLYYRPSSYGPLDIAGEERSLPQAVLHHFRRVGNVSTIVCEATIEVMEDLFEERRRYHELVLKRVRSRSLVPGIVFLDPDTGLAPSRPGRKHVLDKELNEIWKELRTDDLLVFYQHQTNRKGAPWIDEKKAQFERAVGLSPGASNIAWAPSIAKDVVFFVAKKVAVPKGVRPRTKKVTQAEKDAASEDFRRTRTPIAELSPSSESGVYVIYLHTRGRLVPFPEGEDGLIYIGRSDNLADREFEQHFSTEGTGFSTLRRSLGALLKRQLALRAIPRAPGPSERNVRNFRFDADGEVKLTQWMRDHLELGIHASHKHLALERCLVKELRPLLNLTMWPNPQRDKIKRLRKACADEARQGRRASTA